MRKKWFAEEKILCEQSIFYDRSWVSWLIVSSVRGEYVWGYVCVRNFIFMFV